MPTIYINRDNPVNGNGTFAYPFNSVASSAASTAVNGNTYLFAATATTRCEIPLNWTLAKTNLTLGSYDVVTGYQTTGPQRAKLTNQTTNEAGSAVTINAGNTINLRVQGLDIINENTGTTSVQRYGVFASATSEALEVTDCLIHAIRSPSSSVVANGIQLTNTSTRGPYIARNEVFDIGEDGIHFQWSPGVVIVNNYVHDISQDTLNGDCVQLANNCSGFVVSSNVLDRRNGLGAKQCIVASGMIGTGGLIAANTTYAVSSDINIYCDAAGSVVTGNFAVGGARGMETQGTNMTTCGNVFVMSGVTTYVGIRISSTETLLVHNNTVLGTTSPDASCIGIHQTETHGGKTIKNNIVGGFGVGVSSQSASTVADYNCLYNNTVDQSFAATMGRGSNNLFMDPELDDNYYPRVSRVRVAGDTLGGTSLNGIPFNNPQPMGAVQNPYADTLLDPQIVTARTIGMYAPKNSTKPGA